MKNSSQTDLLTNVLMFLLFVSAAGTLVLSLQYIRSVKNLQKSQPLVATMNFEKARIDTLARASFEYSRKNPAIMPVLVNFGLLTNTAASTGAPVASPK